MIIKLTSFENARIYKLDCQLKTSFIDNPTFPCACLGKAGLAENFQANFKSSKYSANENWMTIKSPSSRLSIENVCVIISTTCESEKKGKHLDVKINPLSCNIMDMDEAFRGTEATPNFNLPGFIRSECNKMSQESSLSFFFSNNSMMRARSRHFQPFFSSKAP